MEQGKEKKVVLGKVGLDMHDYGVRVIADWLRDAGYEVVYTGLYNTAEGIANIALQEGAVLVGISYLEGDHLLYTEGLLRALEEKNLQGVKVVVGGVIPPTHISKLKDMGVSLVFTPGTRRDTVISSIDNLLG